MGILDINNILFSVLGYPVSFIELAGTVSGIACVYLTAREKVIAWPVGLVNIFFFFFMFYQVQLYSDVLLQIYYLITTFFGWWRWTHPRSDSERDAKDELMVRDISVNIFVVVISISAAGTVALGVFMEQVHILIPAVFKMNAAYPYADAFTTVFSVTAQILMAVKMRQCWLLWISVDIVATAVYFLKGINLVAIEYVLFGIIAAGGYISWSRIMRGYTHEGVSA